MVRSAIKHDLIPNGQFDNQPGKTVNSAALLKVISAKLIRLCRDTTCIFNNDLLACYDRVIPSVSQIVCRCFGLPNNLSCLMVVHILRRMKYRVRTAHSISPDSFSNNLNNWVLGSLQGSGASPVCWIAVFSVITTAYLQRFPSNFDTDPTRGLVTLLKALEAFVNDTDL
jgi:hypothetical protein